VSATRIKVILAEDDLIVREGVQNLIQSLDGLSIVASVTDLPTAEEAVERLEPDVVVTDIRLPPTLTDEGLRLAGTLRQRYPATGVVVLSQHAEPQYVRELLSPSSGGRAYMLKERVTDAGQLEAAIRAVASGESYVDSGVVERLLLESSSPAAGRLDTLTPREIQVIGLIAQAKSNDAVARELGISTRAVERHVNGIFNRLGISDSPSVSRRVMAVLVYLEDQRRRESAGRRPSG
jgi:DNA-binding NarL/FixJ family response regulator